MTGDTRPHQRPEIWLYRDASGNEVVTDEIRDLSKVYRGVGADFVTKFAAVADGKITAPHVKRLTGTNLWELRFMRGRTQFRLLFAYVPTSADEQVSAVALLALRPLVKKQWPVPAADIAIAEARLADQLRQLGIDP